MGPDLGRAAAARARVLSMAMAVALAVLGWSAPVWSGVRDSVVPPVFPQDRSAAWYPSSAGDCLYVNIFGHGAGSDSVNLLMTSPQAIGLFAKAIAMTGAVRNNRIPIRGDAPETRDLVAQVAGSPGRVSIAAAQEAPAAAQKATTEAVEQIVVTGSRIARNDYVSDSPIVTLNREALEVSGPGTMESVLNTLPQFTALRPGSSPSAARGGRNNANLRGLGINRTLILLDGRRMQPSDLQGAVDLNTIPEALISSIDVITGGASATYGSDAIAGVVNFKLNNRFKGVQLDAQYGVTDKGDSGVYDVSGLAGSSFAGDRGHFVAAGSFLRRDFTPRGAREFFHHQTSSSILVGGSITPDASNLPSQAALNSVFARYGFTGTVPRNSTLAVNPDNTLFTTTSTATVPILNLRYGDPPYFIAPDGSRVVNFSGESAPLQQAMDKYNVFLKADFKVADSLTAYGQFMHAHYKTRHQLYSIAAQGLTIPSTNPFIPADLRAVLASRPRPNDPLTYSFGTGRIDAPLSQLDTYNVNQGLVGLKGNVPRFDWTWDLYATRGQTTDVTDRNVNILRSALVALLNAPDGGRSVCPGGYNPFIYDPLNSAPETRACFDYVNRPTTGTAKFSQKIIEGTVQGTVFKLPAGDLKFAAGANYRSNAFIGRPDALSREGLLVIDTVGSPIVPNREGKDHVNEVFGELLFPVLRDLPFVESLTVDVAGRYSNYKSIGGVKTYKASGDWEIARPIRLRGGYQRAIRAPTLDELFPAAAAGSAAIGTIGTGGGDPCDVNSTYRLGAAGAQVRAFCLASGVPSSVIDSFSFAGGQVPTLNPPGAPLKQETADTHTFGVVLSSPFKHPLLSGLRLSGDYYRINLKGAIGTITAPIALSLCFNSNGASNPGYSVDNVFCRQITRDASGAISQILTPRLNLASYTTSGIDAQLDWTAPLSALGLDEKWGRVALNAVVSYTKDYKIQKFVGDVVVNYAGTIGNGQIDSFSISHPTWKAQASATWNVGNLSTTLRGRWIDSMFNSLDASGTTRTRAGVPSKTYFDLYASWHLRDDLTVRASVVNLADTQPPFFAVEEATDVALYDILGRRFSIGVTKRF